MGAEITVAREGGVNPINAIGKARGIMSITPKGVFGHELTAGDKVGFLKMRAFLAGGKDAYDIDKRKLDAAISERAVNAEISTKDIYPSQTYLNEGQVQKYVQAPDISLSDRNLGIVGYRLPNGKVILDDGHHRAAAQIINGAKSINMRVVNVNEYYAQRFFKSLNKKKG